MFPKSKINLFYRILCMLAYIGVIIFINSFITLLVLTISFFILTISEKKVENLFLYVITIIIFVICLTVKNYLYLRIIVCFDYIFYFLSAIDYSEEYIEEDIVRDQNYIRFKTIKKIKKKESNNMLCTAFVLMHMILLLLAIVVG